MEYKRFKTPNVGFSLQLFYLKRKILLTKPAKKKKKQKNPNLKYLNVVGNVKEQELLGIVGGMETLENCCRV